MHFVTKPLAFVISAIAPFKCTGAVHPIVDKLPQEDLPINPSKDTKSILHTIDVVSFKFIAVWARLASIAVRLVILPKSRVLCAVNLCVSSVPVGAIIKPIAFVHLAVGLDESSFAVGLAIPPVANVLATILPDLRTLSLPLLSLSVPLAQINSLVVQLYWPLHSQLSSAIYELTIVLVKYERLQRLLSLSGDGCGVVGHLVKLNHLSQQRPLLYL